MGPVRFAGLGHAARIESAGSDMRATPAAASCRHDRPVPPPPPPLVLLRALALALLAATGPAHADCPEGCPSRCPDQRAAQSEFVRQHFSLLHFWGTYYELQYHDNTQPRLMSCQRSVKSPNTGGTTYKDLFSLHVIGDTTAVCDLEFNISAAPGVFLGHWRGSFRPDLTNINNTVIDVGVAKNGSYEWSLEFQCADNATAAAKAGTPSGVISRRRDCHFANTPVPSLSKRLIKEAGVQQK